MAAHLAYRLRANFSDGVLWAQLDIMPLMDILRLFAEAYGYDVTNYDHLGSRSQAVRGQLSDKQAMVILDNVQLDDEINYLLPPSGSCAVLVTTRQRNLPIAHGAQRIYLEPFDSKKDESLILFALVLGEERISKEREELLTIADWVDHLPLAIDIAACRLAYEPGWTAAAFLTRLQQEPQPLKNLTYANRSVYATFLTSYERLPCTHQAFFKTLGILGKTEFSLKSMAAITGVTTDETEIILRDLFALSFLRRGRSRHHYRLTPLMLTFAREVSAISGC